jgi:hypothetical protein
MVRNNRILLKIIVYTPTYGDGPQKLIERVRLEAVEVVPGINAPALFRVPQGYSGKMDFNHPDDSISVTTDTLRINGANRKAEEFPPRPAEKPGEGSGHWERRAETTMRKPIDNH